MLIKGNTISALCEITTLDNLVLAKGKISEITVEYIEITNFLERMQITQENLLVKFTIYSKSIETYIGSAYFLNSNCIRIKNIREYKRFEKRQSYRVGISINSEGYSYLGRKKILYDYFNPFNLTIMDLSLTGLLICTPEYLEIDRKIGILMPLEESIVFDCKVVRIIDNTYGCEFLDISHKQEKILSTYILEEQREIIRRNKSLAFF